MSTSDFAEENFVELLDERDVDQQSVGDGTDDNLNISTSESGDGSARPHTSLNFSLVVGPGGIEKQFNVDDLKTLSEYLNRESSIRYRAIVLSTSGGQFDSSHFEVGLV